MRTGFHARLWGALLLTLLALGAVQYAVLSHDTRTRLFEDQARVQRADAVALVRAYQITVPGQVPLNSVNRYLRAVEARPRTTSADFVDGSGARLAAGTVLGIGVPDPDKHVVRTIKTGRQYAGPADDFDKANGHIIFVTPVKGLPGGRHALVVRMSRKTIDSRLGDIRQTLILLLLGGALLAVPAFYFFGGRSLSRAHRAALRRAVSDGLTDLPNHRAFQDSLEREVALAQRHGTELALALVDIDDFRFHNDSEGHAKADETLKRVGESLGGGRVEDQVFRTGGDEFAVILPRTSTEGAVATIRNAAERLARVSSIEFSAGVAAVAPETEDADSLLSQADAALMEAKRRGGAQCSTFADVEDARLVTAAKVRAVRRMLTEARMDAAYQPIFDIDGKRVLGYEGLARPAAEYGLNGPGEAFDVAGAIGRSPELDELCRRAVLRGARDLPDGVLLFMNVAPQSLDGERLTGDVLAREARLHGLEPGRIVVEVTERFEGRIERVVSEARRLRALGFKLALDDVGAGNSGLQMLRELEADFVKVDREVVVGAVSDTTSRAVLVSIMAFARQTQALVVAEGIEDEEMLAMVADPTLEGETGLHAQAVQGYLLGRPGPLPAAAGSPVEKVLGSL